MDLKEEHHTATERLEVEELVEPGVVFDVHEEGHSEDGVDEHDQKEKKTDVEESGQRDGQREEQRPDALGRLDQS